MGALAHASQKEERLVIHTDSRAAIDSLQYNMANDNTYLLTTVLTTAQRILDQGGRIVINWVPSHTGIRGNERADRLTGTGMVYQQIP